MSPAGDWDCARAAVENGADAIYFGLQGGFNARARAANFSAGDLPELMTYLRTRGVRGYLTLNTLVFSDELEQAEQTVRLAAAAGVDAILVQDLGLLRLIQRLAPTLPLHASTQMTLSSAECIQELESLGVQRVVLPRELSIAQIAAIRQPTGVELEAFVHGALCISYSGQCLASLSMGGRSANRGQCAQPCRLPYEVVCDGQRLPTADARYPLSPHDLAAYSRLPELMAAGVAALKIEGRLKPAEYVASATRRYREAINAICRAESPPTGNSQTEALAELEMVFSRGFCQGWLDGPNHRTLVSGSSSAKRGILLGKVCGVQGERILVELAGPIRRGDGVVFAGDRSQATEQGGRVYEVFQGRRSIETEVTTGVVALAFRYQSIRMAEIQRGQKVWKTDDPHATRRLRKTYVGAQPIRRVAVDLAIEAVAGRPLRLVATTATGAACQVPSPEPLAVAAKHPLTIETLRTQLGRLGKTPYVLRHVEAKIEGQPMIPLSVLGKLRHAMLRQLDEAVACPPPRHLLKTSALAALRAESRSDPTARDPFASSPAALHVLCRSWEQMDAALSCGVRSILADPNRECLWADAVRRGQSGGAKVLLCMPRIHQPGESSVFEAAAAARPDGVVVRNLAGLAFFRRLGLPMVADFSFHAVNELTVDWLHARGAQRITAAYDLNQGQLFDLTSTVPPQWLEVVMRRHPPLFHTAYCLFCSLLSTGTNRADCGRPCERHELRLRDRRGVEHLLSADGQCRNTVFHGEAEDLSSTIGALRRQGVRDFRIELLTEKTAEEVHGTIRAVTGHLESS
jgi:putative protease